MSATRPPGSGADYPLWSKPVGERNKLRAETAARLLAAMIQSQGYHPDRVEQDLAAAVELADKLMEAAWREGPSRR